MVLVLGGVRVTDAQTSSSAAYRVNVVDYGATPNDSTDDSAAFQNAMAAAVQGGGIAYVPAGTYRVAGVNIPSNTDLAIQNTATIKKYGTSSGPVFSMQGVADTSFAHDIDVYGVDGRFTVDVQDAGSDTTPFRLRSVKNFSIKHVDFLNNNSNNGAVSPDTLKPDISFLPMDSTKLNGEWEHPIGGTIEDAHAYHAAFGWGLTQLTGAQNIHFQDISSEGGVALRLENYQSNITTVDGVTADNVTCTNGHNAVSLNPHNADNGEVHVTGVKANSCWQAISVADDPAYPNGNFDATSTIDGVTVTPATTAQVRDFSGLKVGSWTTGNSAYCVDADANLTYTLSITNLSCGGLPNRNWPQ
jgi:polygalacturonase